MKSFKPAAFFLFSVTVLPCLARSTARATPPNPLTIHSLSTNHLEKTIPPRVPYDVEYDSASSIRITKYSGPHISSDTVLPCLVDMLNSAFSAVWKQDDQHPKLDANVYECQKGGLDFRIEGTQTSVPIEFPDLAALANMIFYFQQTFVTPGLTFEYWFKGRVIGTGTAQVLLAGNATKGALAQE